MAAGRDLGPIRGAVEDAGLVFRGAFHPAPEDAPPCLANGKLSATLVLLGIAGRATWRRFARSDESADGRPDALDRWSRRVVGELARGLDATAFFPFGGPPHLPFYRWAQRAEPVHPSRLGILIHPDWGLWHSYRGALGFADRLALREPDARPRPCDDCADTPCLSACPVGAFTSRGYDVSACAAHLSQPAGADCMDRGCAARRACPVGAGHAYAAEQASFHMRNFLASRS